MLFIYNPERCLLYKKNTAFHHKRSGFRLGTLSSS
ncbi:hypothetical protein NC653_010875 [Populus alba x Populus x berolinensis]|uniref:Uncharacterized protein n=1 Tax=Populus alba x Populus x berolinensis TaxID=444605 RepID=A0AAD6R0R4_9ROSI|nr:hypothetical protein NC653_010875 [Populus alba x Populus x berolinensis]